jgi:hypothetical protein
MLVDEMETNCFNLVCHKSTNSKTQFYVNVLAVHSFSPFVLLCMQSSTASSTHYITTITRTYKRNLLAKALVHELSLGELVNPILVNLVAIVQTIKGAGGKLLTQLLHVQSPHF